MNRRRWLCVALLGAAFAAAQTQVPAQNQVENKPVGFVSGPYLQNPSENSMTIMWITIRKATGSVEYSTPAGELKTAFSSHDGLIDSNECIHKVVLTDLSPGTVYRYRAVSREILNFLPEKVDFGETVDSGFREFRTFDPRKPNFSFLVFNDMHDRPATFSDMLKVAGDRPYDFVLLNGDTLSDIEGQDQIVSMLNAAVSTFASRIPLIWVRGNHETRGGFARQFPAYLSSPNGRYFYSFDQGLAHFIVLDTGEDKADSHPEYSGLVDFAAYRREEAKWLRAEVKTEAFHRAKYRVVFAHMPFPAGGRRSVQTTQPNAFTGMEDDFQSFGATLEEAGIDMMISAHVHSAAIIDPEPGRHSYPIVRGGGPRDQGRTVIRVNVTDRTIEAVILRPDGSAFGACRVAARR
ncbi:MAG: metallophosphoesterase family protein [Bryobacteraceae bacterium]|jgi:hypothetical protein